MSRVTQAINHPDRLTGNVTNVRIWMVTGVKVAMRHIDRLDVPSSMAYASGQERAPGGVLDAPVVEELGAAGNLGERSRRQRLGAAESYDAGFPSDVHP
jgi:hypothetical protein